MYDRSRLSDELKTFLALVKAGRLFDVQKWIADGKPTVFPERYSYTPMRYAMEMGFHSMVEVLLQARLTQEERDYYLLRAVWCRQFEFAQIMVKYGANLLCISFKEICDSGNGEVMRFFLDHGADAVTGQPFARSLQDNPTRAHLGVYLSYRDKIPDLKYQLNLALRHHAQKGSMRWVCLFLWAGGDPKVKLPDIGNDDPDHELDTTALEEAVLAGHCDVVEKIGINPVRDNLNVLLDRACLAGNWAIIEKLLALGGDPNGSEERRPIENLIWRLELKIDSIFRQRSETDIRIALENVTRFAGKGARWTPKNNHLINGLRRALYKLDVSWIERIAREFLKHNVCAKAVVWQIVSTGKMKQIFGDRFLKLKNHFLTSRQRPEIRGSSNVGLDNVSSP